MLFFFFHLVHTEKTFFTVYTWFSIYQYFISFYDQMISQCMALPHFVYSFIHCWAFDLLTITVNVAGNIHVQDLVDMFQFFGMYLGVELLGCMVIPCLVFEELTNFQRSCIILCSNHQWMRVPVPHLCQCFLLSAFLAMLVVWGGILLWFDISLMTKDVDSFVYLRCLSICISWEKYLFIPLAHFFF